MPREPKEDTLRNSLAKAYRIVNEFSQVPGHIAYQLDLIKVYYPEKIHGRIVDSLKPEQVYSIARDLYLNARRVISNLNLGREEMAILGTLASLDEETSEDGIESLEERVAIQLEGNCINEDSPVVKEYLRVLERKDIN